MNNLSDFEIRDGILTKYLGHDSEVTIPATVTVIGSSAFGFCKEIESVIIPEGVRIIESYAFQGCSKLEKVKLPESLSEIKEHAFSLCYRLYDITIPENVNSIGKYALRDVPNVNAVRGKYSNMFLSLEWFYPNAKAVSQPDYDKDGQGNVDLLDADGKIYRVWHRQYGELIDQCGAKTVNGYVDGRIVYTDQTKQVISAFVGNGEPIVVPPGVEVRSHVFKSLGEPTEVFLPADFGGLPYIWLDRDNITQLDFKSWEGIGKCYINPGDDSHPFMKRVTVCGTHLKDIDSITITPSISNLEAVAKIIKHYPNIKVTFAEDCFDNGVKISRFYIPFVSDPTAAQIGSLLWNQSGKNWEAFVLSHINASNINDVFTSVAEQISASEAITPKQVKSVSEWVNDNSDLISKEIIKKIVDALKAKNMKTKALESLLN